MEGRPVFKNFGKLLLRKTILFFTHPSIFRVKKSLPKHYRKTKPRLKPQLQPKRKHVVRQVRIVSG